VKVKLHKVLTKSAFAGNFCKQKIY